MRSQWIKNLVLLGALASAARAAGQVPVQMAPQGGGTYPLPASAYPSLFFVRLAGPPGLKVTVFRGGDMPRTLETPCVLGLRPGYHFNLQLDLPGRDHPLRSCATLDVVGSLRGNGEVRPREHPATIYFNAADFQAVSAGTVVNKVVVVERPETAVPVATRSEFPIEIEVPASRNPLTDAKDRGRPLAIMHLGGRLYSPEELLGAGVPGTMLLPGESVVPAPRDPPCLPWICYSLVDPSAGLSCAADEVCFHDGGDGGRRAGFGPDGKLVGLDASDTIAEYVNGRGEKKLSASNKVCFCVPRFLVMKSTISATGHVSETGAGDARSVAAPILSETARIALERKQQEGLLALATRRKVSAIEDLRQASVAGQMQGLAVYANVSGTTRLTGRCPEPELAEPSDRPLVIIKWPDNGDPQVGDVVSFFIQYKNQGQRPISGIVVNDSLTARLEYVGGTARSDRDALFTITPNEVGSAALRWEVTGSLAPGQSGTVTFKARVR